MEGTCERTRKEVGCVQRVPVVSRLMRFFTVSSLEQTIKSIQ